LLLLGTAEGFRPVSTLLYAMAGREETPIFPAQVIREKSQFRAQKGIQLGYDNSYHATGHIK